MVAGLVAAGTRAIGGKLVSARAMSGCPGASGSTAAGVSMFGQFCSLAGGCIENPEFLIAPCPPCV